MYAAIIQAKVDDVGPDITGKIVPMLAGTRHIVSMNDINFYLDHPDAFTVLQENIDAPLIPVRNPITNAVVGMDDSASGASLPIANKKSTFAKSNQAPFRNHATSSYNFLGYDAIADTVYVNDATGGRILRGTSSDGWQTQAGVTWSSTLGATGPLSYPTDVTYANVYKIVRFKNRLYLLAKATTGSLPGIWSSPVTSGNTYLTWDVSPLLSYQSLATALFTSLDADDQYLYACEYTQQNPWTPKVYRSADGATWETVINESTPGVVRHFHCIAADPYNPGHVYLTCGDGLAKVIERSTDYGATWTVIETSSVWQAVQISFTPNHVYFAGDSQNGIAYRMDRDTLVKEWISPWRWENVPVTAPAALGEQYYFNGWYGVVDPNTEDFYSSNNDSSSGGNTPGLFMTRAGEMPVLMIKPGGIEAPTCIAGGVLWAGKYRKILNQY